MKQIIYCSDPYAQVTKIYCKNRREGLVNVKVSEIIELINDYWDVTKINRDSRILNDSD